MTFATPIRRFVPNALTLFRIVLVPVVCLLLLAKSPEAQIWAIALFIIASATDFLDGYLARSWQVISDFGRLLDPIADKLLILGVLYTVAATGDLKGLAVLAGLSIIIREVAVTGLREFLAARNISVPTTWVAKWKATVQMVALVLVMCAPLLNNSIAGLACDLLMLLAAALTVWSGVDYFVKGLRAL